MTQRFSILVVLDNCATPRDALAMLAQRLDGIKYDVWEYFDSPDSDEGIALSCNPADIKTDPATGMILL